MPVGTQREPRSHARAGQNLAAQARGPSGLPSYPLHVPDEPRWLDSHKVVQRGRTRQRRSSSWKQQFRAKLKGAISTFLIRHGFEIIEEGWAHGKDSIDFIDREDDELVFIDTAINMNDGAGFTKESANRSSLERLAAAYLAEHQGMPEGLVRFGKVNLMVLGDSKAFLRHYRNALSELAS